MTPILRKRYVTVKMDDYYEMTVSKNFNRLIDVKFPSLKITMTPVWPWHDSIHQ